MDFHPTWSSYWIGIGVSEFKQDMRGMSLSLYVHLVSRSVAMSKVRSRSRH